jgi:hypothetical protein
MILVRGDAVHGLLLHWSHLLPKAGHNNLLRCKFHFSIPNPPPDSPPPPEPPAPDGPPNSLPLLLELVEERGAASTPNWRVFCWTGVGCGGGPAESVDGGRC